MDNSNSLDELKKLLSIELAKKESDNDVIIHLSQKIALLDESNIRFSIDAGVIDRLGKELVARQETAVSELVKNSYDADATYTSLTFVESDIVGGTLEIRDDGDGMTRDELINGFMRISSTSKVHNPESRTFKRKRAGKKGIGRFAVQRLGQSLTIITQTIDNDFALELSINWDFYKRDKDLMSISNTLRKIPKIQEQGTILLIRRLRDKWSLASIKRIYRYVSDIIQPFPLSKEKAKKDSLRKENTQDEGILVEFYKTTNKKRKKIADQDTEIYQYAAAKIEGWLDESGIGVYSVESEKLKINEIGEISNSLDDSSISFSKIKNVQFRAYYFIYDKSLIPSTQMTSIQRLAKKKGGIRLYRNGFRVLPYGEQGDDWLNLDKSVRERVILPPHANNSFFGFVELIDPQNIFEETSSREGLTENEAFVELQNFIYKVLITGVAKIANVRKRKTHASQRKKEDGNWEEFDYRIDNIAKTIEEFEKEFEKEGNEKDKKRRKRSFKKLKDDISNLKEEKSNLLKERSVLRVLSSVGLSIAQFLHEIKYTIGSIKSDVNYLIEKLEEDKDALKRLYILEKNFNTFNTYTSYFNDVISKNVIRDLVPINIEEIVMNFMQSLRYEAARSNVKFFIEEFPAYRIYTKPMHPSEWASILFNFYTNSRKAIKRVNSKGKIYIRCGERDKMVYLEFSDNGDGIPKEIEEQIFEEFFTTTTVSSFNDITPNTQILGTGLGLKIVSDIVKSYRGSISVVSPHEDYSTTIRIEIPKATDKDYDKYDL